MSNSIHIRGDYERYEGLATEAISPGMLVEISSATQVKKQTASGFLAEKAVAVENAMYSSDNTTAGVADAYASGDEVQYNIYQPGSKCQVRVYDGEDIAIGDLLVSNGDGTCKERTTENGALFVALTACDMSASSGQDPTNLCTVRVL